MSSTFTPFSKTPFPTPELNWINEDASVKAGSGMFHELRVMESTIPAAASFMSRVAHITSSGFERPNSTRRR
jgi:hypothetical protein